MKSKQRFYLNSLSWLAVAGALTIAALACSSSGGGEPAASTAAVSPTAGVAVTEAPGATPDGDRLPETEATPTATVPLPEVSPAAGVAEPDGDRILEAVKVFADTVGPRVAGTENERIAAGLIADWLDELGYEVELQEFGVGSEIGRSSSLVLDAPDSQTVPTLPFANSGSGTRDGALVYADAGLPEDFPPETPGAIALIRRDGVVFFQEKVNNAIAAGAAGVIIYNNEPGILLGSLENSVEVPVVGISMAEGEDLRSALEEGAMTATVSVGALSTSSSYNVIARPPGETCETVSGGHYDSVALGTGASDNASGTATVLEIAAVLAHNGDMASHCFVLFGGEELGLIGSEYFVAQLTDAEKDQIKAMLNFDMVGVGDEAWWLIGDTALKDQMVQLAADLDIANVVPSDLIRGLSSDHASFIGAGIPALMFHRWEDPLLHTPEDVTGRIVPQYLEEAAHMGIALLQALDTGS